MAMTHGDDVACSDDGFEFCAVVQRQGAKLDAQNPFCSAAQSTMGSFEVD
jgi:hypothetical protein